MREYYISVAPDFLDQSISKHTRIFKLNSTAFKQEWKGTKGFLSCVDKQRAVVTSFLCTSVSIQRVGRGCPIAVTGFLS